jgi:hypothetical protein
MKKNVAEGHSIRIAIITRTGQYAVGAAFHNGDGIFLRH